MEWIKEEAIHSGFGGKKKNQSQWGVGKRGNQLHGWGRNLKEFFYWADFVQIEQRQDCASDQEEREDPASGTGMLCVSPPK